jgi:hypothetical protein
MAKEDKGVAYSTVAYKYYCNKCSRYDKYIIPFEERLNEYACKVCFEKMKYCGGCSIAISSTGNCGYISAEKVSEQNIKRIGMTRYKEMCMEDPLYSKRVEAHETSKEIWWRKTLKDPTKPLPLSKVKDVQKYIETGSMD